MEREKCPIEKECKELHRMLKVKCPLVSMALLMPLRTIVQMQELAGKEKDEELLKIISECEA